MLNRQCTQSGYFPQCRHVCTKVRSVSVMQLNIWIKTYNSKTINVVKIWTNIHTHTRHAYILFIVWTNAFGLWLWCMWRGAKCIYHFGLAFYSICYSEWTPFLWWAVTTRKSDSHLCQRSTDIALLCHADCCRNYITFCVYFLCVSVTHDKTFIEVVIKIIAITTNLHDKNIISIQNKIVPCQCKNQMWHPGVGGGGRACLRS